MGEIAVAGQPAVVINPLTVEAAGGDLDAALMRLVEQAVGTVSNEVDRIVRRRKTAAAVHAVRATAADVEAALAEAEANPSGVFVPAVRLQIDAARHGLREAFRDLNPAASAEAVDAAVADATEKWEARLGEPGGDAKPRRRKVSAGS